MIDLADHGIVAHVGAPQFFFAKGSPVATSFDLWGIGWNGQVLRIVAVDEFLRCHPGRMRRIEACYAEKGPLPMSLNKFHRLVGYERGMGILTIAAEGKGIEGEPLCGMADTVSNAHLLLPYFGRRWQAKADVIELVGRQALHPGAVGIGVGPGFVGDF